MSPRLDPKGVPFLGSYYSRFSGSIPANCYFTAILISCHNHNQDNAAGTMCSPGAPLPFPIPTPILPNKRPPADTTLQPLCLPVGVRLGGGRGLGAGSGAPWEMSLVHPAGLMGSLRGGTVSEPGGADRAAARDGSRRSARRRHGQAGGNGRAERQHRPAWWDWGHGQRTAGAGQADRLAGREGETRGGRARCLAGPD